ncbi:MAG: type II secretion system secretin GspD [Azonexus sp.]|jgi:general secretion pathway protein D|nr:type II secretion system secretin GspD [Azonexus sp.]
MKKYPWQKTGVSKNKAGEIGGIPVAAPSPQPLSREGANGGVSQSTALRRRSGFAMQGEPRGEACKAGKMRAWRRAGVAALWFLSLIFSLLATLPPAVAQNATADKATLNLVEAEIESVIKAVGQYTGNTFLIDPRVKGNLSLVSENPLSKAEALDLLASTLRLRGFAIVRGNGFLKVVPEEDAKLQAAPSREAELRGDRMATQIFHLNYESANNLMQVLRPLISPNNTININPGNNSLVITDYADNLKRLAWVIAGLDVPAVGDLDVVPLRHAIAADVAALVNRLLDPGGQPVAGDAGRVLTLADPRTNSLVIRAPSLARANLAKSLIAKLDQETAQPGNVHVVYLRNADALKLAQTLRAVVAADSGQAAGGGQATSAPTLSATGQQNGPGQGALTAAAPPSALPTGGAGGFIQADSATNTLIITASEPVYRNLRTVIDQLDARRAQVYVESLIVEVSADKAAELGVQWMAASGNNTSSVRVGGGTAFSSGGNNLFSQAIALTSASGLTVPPGNGLTLGLFNQKGGLGALAHALETETKANILSIPNLITLDNEEARIIVGQNVPFITGQYTTAASAGAANVNPFQTVERQDVGLSLRVRPQISEGGTIKMAIYQETSAVQDTSNPAGIITSKRSIETNVLVDDGQVIVLGGLIEDKTTGSVEKVPFLGDIPVLGHLFRYDGRSHTKTNLMVFLRPTVIRSGEQSVNVVTDRYDYIRGVQSTAQPENALPPLQAGQPAGGPFLDLTPRARQNAAPAQK